MSFKVLFMLAVFAPILVVAAGALLKGSSQPSHAPRLRS
jgi:hypothetical protein